MIEAQQKMIGSADLMDLGPILLPTDKASVLVRRRIAELIAKERQSEAECSPAIADSTPQHASA
jgi:hypothetical protein